MPCDDCSRAENCPPCVNDFIPVGAEESSPDDLCVCGHSRSKHWAGREQCCKTLRKARWSEQCGCQAFTPAELEEPAAPAASDFCGQCKHHRRYHDDEMCTVCPAFTADNRHAFVSADAETAGECKHPNRVQTSGDKLRRHGAIRFLCEDCGTGWEETAGEPKAPHEHDWTEWGAVYHGGHFQWRDCRSCGNTESTPEGHFCPECAPVCEASYGCHTPNACQESCAFSDQLKGMRPVPRTPEPEAPEEHVCKPGATLYYCPEAGEVESDCHGGFDVCCSSPERHIQVNPPPRPSYAVAYATGSGELVEIALPGEATCAVVNGALVICHPSTVLGIQQIKPMEDA